MSSVLWLCTVIQIFIFSPGRQWQQNSWKLGNEKASSPLLHILIPQPSQTSRRTSLTQKPWHPPRKWSLITIRIKDIIACFQRCEEEEVVRRSHRQLFETMGEQYVMHGIQIGYLIIDNNFITNWYFVIDQYNEWWMIFSF